MPNDIFTTAKAEITKSAIDELITPILKKLKKNIKINYHDYLVPRGEHFYNYLIRAYDKYSIINTLVFHNSQRKLKEIYVAQTLEAEGFFSVRDNILIDRYPEEILKEYHKILITDTAGMGKSTMMKRMFIDVIDNGIKDIGIPIYIELNRLSKYHTILDEIHKELSSLSEEFDNDLLLYFIQNGGFVFFLDGYDEIAIADSSEVTQDIQNFISRATCENNYFILTSRPEASLPSFGHFRSFRIRPLRKIEAYELLQKYDITEDRVLSKELMELLESGQYNSIREYLQNPLLVSLLYTAFDYGRSIPLEKHRFYGIVFEAYFEKHDFSKPFKNRIKFSGLNHDGFDRVLRYIGYNCLVRIGVKFNKDTILDTIRKAKSFCGNLDFSENDLLKDLTLTVPLFCKEGVDYRWVHKSLLEYFAARYIFCDAKQNQDKILTSIYNSANIEKYINVLDIYFDIDFNGFSKNITLPLCKQFLQFHKNQIKKNEIDVIKMRISQELIEERIGLLFLSQWVFFWNKLSIINFETTDIGYKRMLEKVLKNPIIRGGFHFDNSYIWFAYNLERIVPLIELLYCKHQKLFENIHHDRTYGFIGKALAVKEQPFNRIITIDLSNGRIDNQWYRNINNLMIESQKYRCYLSQVACKKEVERIEKELALSEDDIL